MDNELDASKLIEIMSKEIPIDFKPEYHDGVVHHINNAAKMAKILQNAPLPTNDIDLAPVFNSGGTNGRDTLSF